MISKLGQWKVRPWRTERLGTERRQEAQRLMWKGCLHADVENKVVDKDTVGSVTIQ